MTVTYLPTTSHIHDEAVRQNFEYIEGHGVFIDNVNSPDVTVGKWIAPTLINSWVNTGGALETAGYLKDPLGFVHLKGIVQGGASNTVAFVLPAGYRPGATLKWTTSNTTPAIATINIDISGNVTIFWTGASSLNIGMSGFTFLAEN